MFKIKKKKKQAQEYLKVQIKIRFETWEFGLVAIWVLISIEVQKE